MLEKGKGGGDRFREAGAPDYPGPLDFCVRREVTGRLSAED